MYLKEKAFVGGENASMGQPGHEREGTLAGFRKEELYFFLSVKAINVWTEEC